ncbi:MAG: 1-acyl-sn-glycerol-3-phosphate acyltransferase [Bacteroidales bacterium]|nr:1-acyl-sn-glycerol-3-phosphate acyltransferase [Bacteroidales bacterium]HKL93540.1 1-acyl-sn-glycerol-3-phosphate acyltransferase [Bacteroidales bacterium]
MMPQTERLPVSVRDILKSKAPNTRVPNFLIRYLEHIIHQDEVNAIIQQNADQFGIDFVVGGLKALDVDVQVQGLDTLPPGRYTFAGNHPLGGIDGMATGYAVYQQFPENSIYFLSNDILSHLTNLGPLFVPINKTGTKAQKRSLPQRITEAYESDRQMVIFPAGACSRRIKGKITELTWSKSFVQKSVETKRDIVPVYFEGKNSNFFYTLANIRSFLGIKINFEMLYLADEMFKQRGKTFRIVFGKPIPYQHFDGSKTYQEWANWLSQCSSDLAKQLI